MRSLMEFLAVATLGLVVIWLLRRRWRSFPTIAVVMGAIICSLAMPPAANAAETKNGNPNYTLAAGEEVKTDLIVFADHTQINGDVDGDLIVWSRNVTVNGHVKGDVIAFAQELRRQAKERPDPMLVIYADAGATHQAVVNVLEAARIAGIAKVTFAAQSAGPGK